MKTPAFYLLFILLSTQLSCQTAQYVNQTASEFKTSIETIEGVLVDVRTSGEFNSGYIKTAVNYNYYDSDFKQKLLALPKDKNIYLYCKTGARSRSAASFLASNGYLRVYNLSRGIMDWSRQSFPLEKSVTEPVKNAENYTDMQKYSQTVMGAKVVLVDFYAPWCIPCKKMMPYVEQISKDYAGKLTVLKVNADASKDLIKQLQVQSVPFLAIYKDTKLIFQHAGELAEDALRAELDKALR